MAFFKRYAVFAYDRYYPEGGWKDFRCFCDTLEEVKAVADGFKPDTGYGYLHAVDVNTSDIVYARDYDINKDGE